MNAKRFLISILAIATAACASKTFGCGRSHEIQTAEGSSLAATDPAAPPRTLKIAFLGDSLTAGLGLLSEQAYPMEIQRMFQSEGYQNVEIVNFGISGDTTAGGLQRLDDALESDVRILVVALGANDALRGISPQETHDNLAKIIERTAQKGVAVLLAGMMAPPNLGPDYRDAFSAAFVNLGTEYQKKIVYVPFLLEGVAGVPELNQPDGIHPNAEGAKVVAKLLYPPLHTLVDSIQ